MNEKKMKSLIETFAACLQENVRMQNYTTIQIGGQADALLIAHNAHDLQAFTQKAWELDLPLLVLGSGSNILVSDAGVRGVVVVNHAHNIRIDSHASPPTVTVESGALMAKVAKQVALRGCSGFEWAASIPGTVGGAVYGNAGCFGQETGCNLLHAQVLHREHGLQTWASERLNFVYRASSLKQNAAEALILSATFKLENNERQKIFERMEKNKARRLRTQPPGASMGSVFRNPPGDKAGRLIEEVGLKGKRIGGAEISPLHANFIINTGGASAQDVWELIDLVQRSLEKKFGILLHPEIQLVGDWDEKILERFEQFQQAEVA